MSSYRVLASKILSRQCLVDHDHLRTFLVVALRKVPALQQRYPHRLKVPRTDVAIIGIERDVKPRLLLDGKRPSIHVGLAERDKLSQTSSLHPGYAAHPFQKIMKRRASLRDIPIRRTRGIG